MMFFLRKLLFLSLLSLSFIANAEIVTQTKVSTATGVGIGMTREQAVDNALLEAIGQINGVKIRRESISSVASLKSTEGNRSDFAYSSQIEKITQGKVDSFSILDIVEQGENRFEATVEVKKTITTKKAVVPGPKNNRRTLAVIPFDAELEHFRVPSMNYPVSLVTKNLTQEVVSEVTKTRKFSVLDRESFKAYNFEKRLLQYTSANSDELLRFGKTAGADYLLVGNLAEFDVQQVTERVAITGQTSNYMQVKATLQYRILATMTMQVKWSDTISVSLSYPKTSDFTAVTQDAYQQMSKILINQMIENIYPIKIASISSSGQAVLSQSVEEGRQFEVFSLGKKIYDPYTKEYLGQEESSIGTIEVVRKLPKVSYAMITSGKAKQGMIVRPIKASDDEMTSSNNGGNAGGVTMENGGGVRLPFD